MSLFQRNPDRKSRRLISAGCICLSLGLALRIFVHPVALNERILLHVIVGCLLGLSIGLLLFGAKAVRSCRADRT